MIKGLILLPGLYICAALVAVCKLFELAGWFA